MSQTSTTDILSTLSLYLAVEVSGLTEETVLLVGTIGAAVLVVAAVGAGVTGSVP